LVNRVKINEFDSHFANSESKMSMVILATQPIKLSDFLVLNGLQHVINMWTKLQHHAISTYCEIPNFLPLKQRILLPFADDLCGERTMRILA